MNNPKVSIIIATFNRAGFLEKAIKSVYDQTFTDWEIVIVDDFSTDNTSAVVQKYLTDDRIRYFKNTSNQNARRTRNYGLTVARGEYVADLDDDDQWLNPSKLEKQVSYLDAHPNCGIIGGGMRVVTGDGTVLRDVFTEVDDAIIRSKILSCNQFIHSSVLYRKKIALDVGGFDESLCINHDYDLWLKIGIVAQFANLPSIDILYTIHDVQLSRKKLVYLRENLIVLKRYKKYFPGFWRAWVARMLRYQISKLFYKE